MPMRGAARKSNRFREITSFFPPFILTVSLIKLYATTLGYRQRLHIHSRSLALSLSLSLYLMNKSFKRSV